MLAGVEWITWFNSLVPYCMQHMRTSLVSVSTRLVLSILHMRGVATRLPPYVLLELFEEDCATRLSFPTPSLQFHDTAEKCRAYLNPVFKIIIT